MKQWKVLASAVLVLGMGLWLLWLAVAGLQNGAVQNVLQFSPTATGVVLRTAQPFLFWYAVLFFLLTGAAGVWLGLLALLALWRKMPAAQVRQIEAGQGPEPPWVRFPGPADALPEAAMTAYLENVFAPFWLPLGAEARAAYLRRNPPPSGEWQQYMATLLDWDVPPD